MYRIAQCPQCGCLCRDEDNRCPDCGLSFMQKRDIEEEELPVDRGIYED